MIEPIKLDGYLLWADGTVQVAPEVAADWAMRLASRGLSLERLTVTHLTAEVERFNELSDVQLRVKTELLPVFPPDWILPDYYKYLDISGYLEGLTGRIEHDALYEKRLVRLADEIFLFTQLKLEDVLRALIYVVDQFKKHGVVWGVGRGSSCSSYLLYLLGLHEVDPVKFEIDISDFIKPTGE